MCVLCVSVSVCACICAVCLCVCVCVHVPMYVSMCVCSPPLFPCLAEVGSGSNFSLLCCGGSPQGGLLWPGIPPQGLPPPVLQCVGCGDHLYGVSTSIYMG